MIGKEIAKIDQRNMNEQIPSKTIRKDVTRIEEIDKWFTEWKTEVYGPESLKGDRYFEVYDDGGEMVGILGNKYDYDLAEEQEICNKILTLLCKLGNCNLHLQETNQSLLKRNVLKMERDNVYNELITALNDVSHEKDQPTPTQTLPIPNELSTPEATKLFQRAIGAGLMENASEGWKWLKTASLFGYFVDKVSDHLKIQSEGDRIPWKLFDYIVLKGKKTTARQAVNGYKNKSLNPPEGFREVDNLFK